MVGPRWVHQAPVVAGQLGVPSVDLRVIQVRLAHPRLQVVRNDPAVDTRQGIRTRPRAPLTRPAGSCSPWGGRTGVASTAAPSRTPIPHGAALSPDAATAPGTRNPPGLRLPAATAAAAAAPALALYLAREMRPHVPAQAGHARGQALLVGQPLVDHRHRHHGQQPRDPVMINRDLPPGHLPDARPGQLREPVPGQRPPLLLSLTGGPPGAIPAASAGATYWRTVFASTPRLRATSTFGRPAYQCCKISVTSTVVNVLLAISVLRPKRTKDTLSSKDQERNPPRPNRHGQPRENAIGGVGNYLIAAGP